MEAPPSSYDLDDNNHFRPVPVMKVDDFATHDFALETLDRIASARGSFSGGKRPTLGKPPSETVSSPGKLKIPATIAQLGTAPIVLPLERINAESKEILQKRFYEKQV